MEEIFEGNLGRFSSEDEQDIPPGPSNSRKRLKYHRHTPYQIQELESFFKDNPHPDEKERLTLGKKLNLESKQVKFWFQNRRTQMKSQLERHENAILKQANDELRLENMAMKEAIRSPICNQCGGHAVLGDVSIDKHRVRIENARLRDELNRVSILTDKFMGRALSSFTNSDLELAVGRNGFGGVNAMVPTGSNEIHYEKTVVLELALAAMDELMKLGQVDRPIWVGNVDGRGESMDFDEYLRGFPLCLGMKPHGFVSEASRASGVAMISGLGLVEALLDANCWKEMFLGMIGSSSTLEVISSRTGDSRNGVLQLMQAEIQLVSPLVPPRLVRFVRFCKRLGEGAWAVVDVSVDSGTQGLGSRRLPSGCIVHDMPNGYSKITWIEHTEYDESVVHHQYRPLLRSGLGFGAQKWISTLQRHFESLAAIMTPAAAIDDNPGGRRSLTNLAKRMTRNFCAGICATGGQRWEVVGNTSESARIMICKSLIYNSREFSGDPSGGAVLSAATSVWMPIPHQNLFALLLNEELRSRWDVLSNGAAMHNVFRFHTGQDSGNPNGISLLRGDTDRNTVVVLQESSTSVVESRVVFAAVDVQSVTAVMGGGDSSGVVVLPSGFSMVPDCEAGGGSLMTVGFQILVSDLPTSRLTVQSIETVVNLINRTVQGVKEVVQEGRLGSS